MDDEKRYYLMDHAVFNGEQYQCRYCGEDLGRLGSTCYDCFFVCDECFLTKHVLDLVPPTSPAFYPGGSTKSMEFCQDCYYQSLVPDIKTPEE